MAVVSNIDQLDTLSPSVSLTEQNSQQSHRASSPVEELATDHSQVTTTHSEVFTARPQVSTSQLDVNVELPTIKPSVPSQRPVPSRVYRQPKKVTQQVSIRSLILYGFNQNKSTTETMNMICDTMGPRAVSIATVRKWYKQFRSGNFNIDNPRSS
ncbi:Histone-lysine N-methyltransferase SETMAR [Aphelenchoides besseyi]|nr:Histone-lysine N-methyltransferase SETMAR [Aphelenchoides besseyi]